MAPSSPNDIQLELDFLFAAADDFHQAESPGSTSGGKRSSPDDDEDGNNSPAEDENIDHGDENETGLE